MGDLWIDINKHVYEVLHEHPLLRFCEPIVGFCRSKMVRFCGDRRSESTNHGP